MDTEIVLKTPNDLIGAIKAMMLQMNKRQRKQFLMWVKDRRKEYDFRYPEGYKYKEPKNEITVPAANIVDPSGSVVASVVPTLTQDSSKPSEISDSPSSESNADTSNAGNESSKEA